MSQKYAKDQPSSFTNRIERVTIIGASGHLGKHFAEALVKTGKHTVTALTRLDSKGAFPEGLKVARVNFEDEDALVSALNGQQFLVITLSVHAPPDMHTKLVQAAAKAGVPYVMPNVYGGDILNKSFREDSLYGAATFQRCVEVESTGVSSYVAMVCGLWYEWSLALGSSFFGFDTKSKKVIFYDDGNTIVNSSTWLQCGKALAGLLSLKELPDNKDDESPTVSQWKNKPLYISSFRLTQRDILESINKLTGTTEKDWEISYETTAERYKIGLEEFKQGDRLGFAKALYALAFVPNGDADYESRRSLANPLIGLPEDDLQDATKRALEMVESGFTPFG